MFVLLNYPDLIGIQTKCFVRVFLSWRSFNEAGFVFFADKSRRKDEKAKLFNPYFFVARINYEH